MPASGPTARPSATATVAQNLLQLLGLTLESTPQSMATATSGSGTGISGPTTNTQNDGALLAPEQKLLGLDTGSLGISGGAGLQAVTKAVAANSAAGAVTLVSGQTMPNSSLPFAQGLATQSGPVSLGLSLSLLNLLGINIGSTNLSLLNITPLGNTNPDVATVCQQATSGASCSGALPTLANLPTVAQPTYPGAAVVAQAQKNFLDIAVLPLLPGGALIDISGFSSAASAAAGPGISGTGKSSTTAGTISVLGHSVSLTTVLQGLLPPAVTTVSSILGTIGVTATLTMGAPSQTGNSATVSSPLNLTVALNLAGVLTLNVTVNLGSVTANAATR